MILSGDTGPLANRPFFLIYLLPLIVEAGIIVSYATGFVPVDSGSGFGPSGPSYGFPFPFRGTYCELLPCAYFLDWSAFWVDVIFYVGLQYVLVIFFSAHIGKIPRPSLSQLQDPKLAFPFGLVLFGSSLMAFVPPLLLLNYSPAAVAVCRDPSPCLTQQNYYTSIWNLAGTIWTFSSFITLFVGLMIGLVGNLGRQFMGAILAGLVGGYIIGIEVLLASGVTAYLRIGSVQLFGIASGLSIAPLLVFLAAMRLATNGRPFTNVGNS